MYLVGLPLPSSSSPPSSKSSSLRLLPFLLLFSFTFYLSFPQSLPTLSLPSLHSCHSQRNRFEFPLSPHHSKAACPKQVDPLDKGGNWDPSNDQTYVEKAIERLRGSVKIVPFFSLTLSLYKHPLMLVASSEPSLSMI